MSVEFTKVADALKGFRLFQNLTDSVLLPIIQGCTTHTRPAHAPLWSEGDPVLNKNKYKITSIELKLE
jgi:hypothetical protein